MDTQSKGIRLSVLLMLFSLSIFGCISTHSAGKKLAPLEQSTVDTIAAQEELKPQHTSHDSSRGSTAYPDSIWKLFSQQWDGKSELRPDVMYNLSMEQMEQLEKLGKLDNPYKSLFEFKRKALKKMEKKKAKENSTTNKKD